MRKSTVFISAALTTFVLAILYGVVSAYHGTASTNIPAQTQASPTATEATPPTPETVTPEQAAQIAAQVLSHNDLLSAESASLNGAQAYKITFQSGDTVYLGLDGQILSIQTAPQVIMVPAQVQPVQHKSNKTGNNASHESGNSGGEQEHESGD